MKLFVKLILIISALLTGINRAGAQTSRPWNNKQSAVVLSYDDAIDVHLDNVIPALDSLKLKGTFYLIGSSPAVNSRVSEWRRAAESGHELGNHSLFHPCDGGPGRGFVTEENDLRKYTVGRAVREIRLANTLLKAIDGKDRRTFAYPCGDLKIGEVYFYRELRKDFAGARGVSAGLETAARTDLDNIRCYMISGQPAEYMINLVKEAQKTNALVVFLFHGVGGGHSLNVGRAEHSRLLHYLKANETDIWIAPMVEVAEMIEAAQKR